MKLPEKWKWLLQPLSPARRQRLEMTLGVVLTGAAVVGLSTLIEVDPSKLPSKAVAQRTTSAAERRAEAQLRPEPPPAPRVAPAFVTAVAHGDLDTMEKLHTPGMPLDGMLSLAASSGEQAAVRWLLDHEADVHEEEGTVDAPVLLADEHPEIVALLVSRGAAEATLTTAAHAGAPAAVTRLLAARAPVNPRDGYPLHAAVSSTRATSENRALIIEKLLAAGADPNRDDTDNPLTAAVNTCDARPEERDSASECMSMIKALVKRGARTRGDALVAALGLDEPTRDPVLDALLKARLERGATATALAQGFSIQPKVIKLIVAKGVDWSWHDGEEDAAIPLLAAVSRGDRDYVRALLDAGAPADAHFKDGTCPLGAAIDGAANGGSNADFARIVELLVARGANVNRRLPDGRTPLFAAAESGELRILTALLERGARVNDLVLDDTALDAAEQSGHQPAGRVLHAHGARRAPRKPSRD